MLRAGECVCMERQGRKGVRGCPGGPQAQRGEHIAACTGAPRSGGRVRSGAFVSSRTHNARARVSLELSRGSSSVRSCVGRARVTPGRQYLSPKLAGLSMCVLKNDTSIRCAPPCAHSCPPSGGDRMNVYFDLERLLSCVDAPERGQVQQRGPSSVRWKKDDRAERLRPPAEMYQNMCL